MLSVILSAVSLPVFQDNQEAKDHPSSLQTLTARQIDVIDMNGDHERNSCIGRFKVDSGTNG